MFQLTEAAKRNYLWSIDISFGKEILYRECVFSDAFNIEEIKKYLSKSLKIHKDDLNLEVKRKCEVRILDNVKQMCGEKGEGFISSYWLDGTMYVVQIKDEIQYSIQMMIDELDKCEEMKKYVSTHFPKSSIYILDIKDVWVSRLE